MLDPDAIDLEELGLALDDNDPERSWWIDPGTGEIRPHLPDVDGEETPEEDGWTYIGPAGSRAGYQDMADFVAVVPDRRAADALDRAITGRGAFRRFKDTLFEFPDLREQWFRFRDARTRRRALDWLEDEDLISGEDAERTRARHPDPSPVADPLAGAVAADLRELYGERLREVLLFGSRARGDHREDSDMDLLVVLTDPVDPWAEMRATDEILWRHSLESDIVVTAFAVGESEWRDPTEPFLVTAAKDAVPAA